MDHNELVEQVRAAVRARPKDKQLTVLKKRPGHTPHDYSYKAGKHPVDVSKFDRVLEIDVINRTVVAQGEVNMGELCAATIPHGLMPAVVPELETFTVAGLINGLGIETSSHRHGIFPMNVPEFEVVLGDGALLQVDENNHSDLYSTLPGSYGTLGIVTKAKVYLVDAKPFVRSRYRHFSNVTEYVKAFRAALEVNNFVEGFIMGPDSHVLITGDFSDAVPGLKTYHAMKHGNLWYYEHAEKQAHKDAEDLVPVYEYVFRHQRSLLWVSRFANFLHLPMTRLGRWWLDRQVTRAVREIGLTSDIPHGQRERSVVMQDAAVIVSRLEEGIQYAKKHFGVYPFWNCAAGRAQRGPYGVGSDREMLFVTDQRRSYEERRELERTTKYAVDIGLYGEPTVPGFRALQAIRALQNFVDVPAMWGVCYLTKDQFEELWDIRTYETLREKYHALEAFPHITEKVCNREPPEQVEENPSALWRLSAFYHSLKRLYRGI